MAITFRPAVREKVPLLISLAGGTGSGKTYSALRLARGIAAEKTFVLIDTEAGRAQHYADMFAFDHADLAPPFSPSRYVEAIAAADAAGYPVVVVDSMSHVWAGDGGCLDMQEAEFNRMGGRDAVKMASWIRPKGEHKRMVSKLIQLRAHVILCFRAEPKIEMARDDKGKMTVTAKQGLTGADGWFPVCEKMLPYEMTLSLLLLATKPGVPVPIKLQEQHRPFISLTTPLDEHTGEHLRAWSAGGKSKPTATAVTADRIPENELQSLRDAVLQLAPVGREKETVARFCKAFDVARLEDILTTRLDDAWDRIKSVQAKT